MKIPLYRNNPLPANLLLTQVRRFWAFSTIQSSVQSGFIMPTVIILIVIMSSIAYATVLQANNSLNLAYKQSYIQMTRTASKAAIDYAQEQFDSSSCGNYSGTPETNLTGSGNTRYRITMQASVQSTSSDGFEKTIIATGRVYLPKASASALYVFDIRSEIVRTFAVCKTPDNFGPLVWLDASNTASLFKPGTFTTTPVTATTSFGNASNGTRDTLEERADNGSQTTASWQSNDLEMNTCDSGEFSSSTCSSAATKYLNDGIIFQNVNVPKNATISSAVINYDCASGGKSGSLTHQVYGIYKSATNPHPDLFSSSSSNQLRTALATNGLHTVKAPQTTLNNCPPGNGQTMDATTAVQEIVNNANWDPTTGGGRMGFAITQPNVSDKGIRDFNKDNIRLVINYTTPVGPQPTTASGDQVAEWHDLSGNGYNALLTYGAYPTRQDNQINGKTVVRINNAAFLSAINTISNQYNMTVFAVMRPCFSSCLNGLPDSQNEGRIVSGNTTGASGDATAGVSLLALMRHNTAQGFSNDYSANGSPYKASGDCNSSCANKPYLVVSNLLNGSQGSIMGNNTVLGTPKTYFSPGPFSINQLYFGGSRNTAGVGTNFFNGDYGEIVVYNKSFTCHQVEAIEEYFRAKWLADIIPAQWPDTCPPDGIPTL